MTEGHRKQGKSFPWARMKTAFTRIRVSLPSNKISIQTLLPGTCLRRVCLPRPLCDPTISAQTSRRIVRLFVCRDPGDAAAAEVDSEDAFSIVGRSPDSHSSRSIQQANVQTLPLQLAQPFRQNFCDQLPGQHATPDSVARRLL